tara:strand:- start:122 stop:271 length:150 start_codon:yes stop_codon:yes gene_type:complete
MDNKNRVVDDSSLPVERQPYMRPQISDVGSIDEQTHGTFSGSGSDSSYS